MGRKEEMFQYAREKLTPYISERANLLRKDCAAYLEMKREYHRIVSDLLQTAQKRQAAGTLGQIHYFMSWKKSAGPISITCISWPASSLVRNLWMLLS